MPLTVEPLKPCRCHKQRYVNLWVKSFPFSLDTLVEVPKIFGEGSIKTKCDDKSDYDHISIRNED